MFIEEYYYLWVRRVKWHWNFGIEGKVLVLGRVWLFMMIIYTEVERNILS
jgi:hypothetical protein